MSKAADLAKVSAKGSFHYLWGLVLSTMISSVGAIFIARLLAPDQYGLYLVVLTVPNLLFVFGDLGMNSAIVRFAAQYRAEGRTNEIKSVYLSGILFELVLDLILTLFTFFFANFLATNLFSRPIIAPLIKIVSFSVMATGIISAATAVFTGYEKMELNSIMIIAQSGFKTTLILSLVVLGLGAGGATTGFTVGTIIASLIGLVLIWTIYRRLPKPVSNKLEIKAYMSTMLTYCLPLSFSTVIRSLLPQYYAFLLPIYYITNNDVIGNYGVAMNFVVLITFFATPVTAMMFPAFSKLDAEKDKETLKSVFQFSVKYASLLVVPITALVICLSRPAVVALFGSAYSTAPLILALIAIEYLYAALGNLSINGLLNGQGRTGYVSRLALLTAAIGFPVGYTLIMTFGVLGLIAIILTANVPSLFIGLRFIKKTYGITVDWQSSLRILISSAIAASVTYGVISLLALSSWLGLILGVVIFMTVLIPSVLFTRSINKYDIANLRDMASGLGVLGKLLKIFLDVMEKLMIIVN